MVCYKFYLRNTTKTVLCSSTEKILISLFPLCVSIFYHRQVGAHDVFEFRLSFFFGNNVNTRRLLLLLSLLSDRKDCSTQQTIQCSLYRCSFARKDYQTKRINKEVMLLDQNFLQHNFDGHGNGRPVSTGKHVLSFAVILYYKKNNTLVLWQSQLGVALDSSFCSFQGESASEHLYF